MSLSTDLTAERENLEELVRSPGWSLFHRYLTERFLGPGYFNAMNAAFSTGDTEKARRLHEVAKEVTTVMNWPVSRLNDLKGDPTV